MKNSTGHSYQLINIFDGYSNTNNKWKGAPMITIQFRNLDTGADLETYVIVPGTYKDGMRDCKGFANWRQWESIIRYFDDYKKNIFHFDPEITNIYGQSGSFITKKNNQTYVINADTKPVLTDRLVNDYQPVKPISHVTIQEQLDNTFGMLFDAEDIIQLKDGGYAIERVIK